MVSVFPERVVQKSSIQPAQQNPGHTECFSWVLYVCRNPIAHMRFFARISSVLADSGDCYAWIFVFCVFYVCAGVSTSGILHVVRDFGNQLYSYVYCRLVFLNAHYEKNRLRRFYSHRNFSCDSDHCRDRFYYFCVAGICSWKSPRCKT